MVDATQVIDTLKIRFYNDWLFQTTLYEEGESNFHKQLTTEVVKTYIEPMNLPKDAHILDLGSGPGYFCDEMKSREYTNYTAVTLSDGDIKTCKEKGHRTAKYDISFLPVADGYTDESVDLIFARHSLEHSPYPIFTLIEWNRILKQGAKVYIEVPQPDCDRRHEWNSNHFSILGANQLAALLDRAGFTINVFNNIEFDLVVNQNEDGSNKTVREKFYCVVATKTKPLDIK